MDCHECLRKAKDKAVLKIVRRWGIPDKVKINLVNQALDALSIAEVGKASKYASELEVAYGLLQSMQDENDLYDCEVW